MVRTTQLTNLFGVSLGKEFQYFSESMLTGVIHGQSQSLDNSAYYLKTKTTGNLTTFAFLWKIKNSLIASVYSEIS